MELVCAPRLGPEDPPPAHILYLKHRRQEFHLMSLLDGSHSKSKAAPGHWRLRAESRNFRLEAEVRCRLADAVEARYTDPDGAPAYCVDTEVADAEVRAWTRAGQAGQWEPLEPLHSHGTTHAEWGDDAPHEEVDRKVTLRGADGGPT